MDAGQQRIVTSAAIVGVPITATLLAANPFVDRGFGGAVHISNGAQIAGTIALLGGVVVAGLGNGLGSSTTGQSGAGASLGALSTVAVGWGGYGLVFRPDGAFSPLTPLANARGRWNRNPPLSQVIRDSGHALRASWAVPGVVAGAIAGVALVASAVGVGHLTPSG